MIWLFDGNVLIAMMLPHHPDHHRVHRWLATIRDQPFATCSVTEGTLLRMHMQLGHDQSAAAAWQALTAIHSHPMQHFWPENFSYTEISPTRLTSHRQITDSWLAELARRKGGNLATLDVALSTLWPDATLLIPV